MMTRGLACADGTLCTEAVGSATFAFRPTQTVVIVVSADLDNPGGHSQRPSRATETLMLRCRGLADDTRPEDTP